MTRVGAGSGPSTWAAGPSWAAGPAADRARMPSRNRTAPIVVWRHRIEASTSKACWARGSSTEATGARDVCAEPVHEVPGHRQGHQGVVDAVEHEHGRGVGGDPVVGRRLLELGRVVGVARSS